MDELLDQIEREGFASWSEVSQDWTALLSDDRRWHQLRQQITALKAYAVEADKVVKLVGDQQTDGWQPCGHALGNDLNHIRAKFRAEHPEAYGDLRINPPDAAGFRKLEFRGVIHANHA